MIGTIEIEDLKIHCIIGVYPEERLSPQNIFLTLQVGYDLSRCVQSDRVHDTIDYVQLAKVCQQLAEKQYHLIETYAYECLKKILAEFPVRWGAIKVRKPYAISNAAFASVELRMEKIPA